MTNCVVRNDRFYLNLEKCIDFVVGLNKATFFTSKFIAHGYAIEKPPAVLAVDDRAICFDGKTEGLL